MNQTIYIEELRINEDGELWQSELVFLSFGREENERDTAWVDSLSTDRQKVKMFKRDEVQCWAFPKSRYDEVVEASMLVADVVVNTIGSGTTVCDTRCRNAEHTQCDCVCHGEFHGLGMGLQPREVIVGDRILTTNYRKVEKRFDMRKPEPVKLGWTETGFVWERKDGPKSLKELVAQQ